MEPFGSEEPASQAGGTAPALIQGTRHAKVKVLPTEIRMNCTGDDPHIVLGDIPASIGPLTLELKIKSTSKGPGQIFWSTAAKPEFTEAQSVKFEARHDGDQWHDYTVKLPAIMPALTHLRLDPGNAPGLVRIARLVLKDADGKVIKTWMGTTAAIAPPTPKFNQSQAVAYYFPNWHRQEGQTGLNFAEWGFIPRAKPRFEGHQQPKHPVWGIEDEADPVVMAKKISTAADHGLSAFLFCWYYHEQGGYLDRALNEGYLRAPNKMRLPFALMWANHDVGTQPFRKGAVTREVFDRMIDLLIVRYFKDPAYWRIGGRCYFSIYQPMTFIQGMGGIAEARAALDAFRKRAAVAGCGELHLNLIDFELSKQPDAMKPVRELGADSVTSYVWIHDPTAWAALKFPSTDYEPVRSAYFTNWDKWWGRTGQHFPNVTMGWDPTPRLRPDQPHTGKMYPDTAVMTGNTPERFKSALQDAKTRADKLPEGRRIVTLYAWNEWTEGGYLEPEGTTGMKYLEAVREVFGAIDASQKPESKP
jgi:hypothetical protein